MDLVDFTLPNVSMFGLRRQSPQEFSRSGRLRLATPGLRAGSNSHPVWRNGNRTWSQRCQQFSDYAGSRRAAWEQRVSVYVPLDGE
jgi:hypothetical protein